MTDIKRAVQALGNHTIALVKGDTLITSDKRGILPMMELISSCTDVNGFSVADKVVGRAAAFLFVRSGIKEIFTNVISQGALDLLKKHGIPATYNILTDKIINRKGDGICPMEKAVTGIDDVEAAYNMLCDKIKNLL